MLLFFCYFHQRTKKATGLKFPEVDNKQVSRWSEIVSLGKSRALKSILTKSEKFEERFVSLLRIYFILF